MQYKIFGENMPAVTMTLDAGESIYTQSGGMTWMTAGMRMETNMVLVHQIGLGHDGSSFEIIYFYIDIRKT